MARSRRFRSRHRVLPLLAAALLHAAPVATLLAGLDARAIEGRGRGPMRMPTPPMGQPPSAPPLPPGLHGLPPGMTQAIMNSLSRRPVPRMGPISDEQLIAELNAQLQRARQDLASAEGAHNIIVFVKYGGSVVATVVGIAFLGPAAGLAAGAVYRGTEGTTEVYVRTQDVEAAGREAVYQGLGEMAGAATGNPAAGFVVRGTTKAGARQLGEGDLRGLFENEKKRDRARTSSANVRTESSHPGFSPSSPAGWRGPIK